MFVALGGLGRTFKSIIGVIVGLLTSNLLYNDLLGSLFMMKNSRIEETKEANVIIKLPEDEDEETPQKSAIDGGDIEPLGVKEIGEA